ncbi:DUF302 domain-containing protein [Thiospirillum jenense]|uniref:DUF302 domain-containing protein n=1 Tax=Thiospirillum jenense TaxID=1653858 RepID=A0A839H4X8_9GAMM|nr:DUF302 domain-containing protein [Thiospirillum jenense]MBB1125105.1 DUF302 domain-containing protein [Thiospirillum jenense]
MNAPKKALLLVGGFLLGILFTGITINLAVPQLLIKEVHSPYDFDKTVRIIQERIAASPRWHVVEVYDQNAEAIAHGGQPIGRMAIIKYCSGHYASAMLKDDARKSLAAMMPKGIAVYENSRGEVLIAMNNGMVMGKLFSGETAAIMEDVSREVEEIMNFMNFKFLTF